MPIEPTPTLAGVLRAAQDALQSGLHVGLPALVQSYDPSTRTATVLPGVQRGYEAEDGSRAVETLPALVVPVEFPGAGGVDITWLLSTGDTGFVYFAEGSIDRWLARGGTVDPGDDRRHTMSDGVFRPGLRPNGAAATSSAGIAIAASEIRAGGTAPLALGSDLHTLISVLKSWTVASGDGGLALQTAINAAFAAAPNGTSVLKGG